MGNDQVNVSSQYPTATKIDNGVAYDISGKQLGTVKGMESDQDPFAGAISAPAPEAAEAKTASEDPFAGSIAAPAPHHELQTRGMQDVIPDGTATSIGPRRTESVWTNKGLDEWLEDVQADVRQGSDTTWVGSLLKRFGAKGTEYGVSPGDMQLSMVGNIPQGLAKIGQSLPRALGGHPIQGVNKAVEGAMDVAAPAMVVQPEAMAFVAPSMIAQHIGTKVATEMGADEETSEFVGNVAGFVAGGGIHKTLHPTMERFSIAVNKRIAAEDVYKNRSRDLETSRKQAAHAQQDAVNAEQMQLDGKASLEQVDEARNLASQAAKNAVNAQKAFEQAAEARANSSIDVEKLHRKIMKSQQKATEKQTSDHAAAKEDFMRAIPPAPSGRAFYEEKDYNIVRRYLEQHHESVEPVEGTSHAYDAFDHIQKDIENKVNPYVQKYAKEPIATNVRMDVRDKLVENPKANFADDGMKELEQYNLTDPTIEEADKIRKQLNDENRAILKKNNWDDVDTALGVDPAFAARYYAAESIRNGEYGTFEHNGVDGIREIRQDEASVIKLRNAAWKQYTHGGSHVRGSGESGAIRKLAAKSAILAGAGTGAAFGYGTGIPLGGEFGAAAGAEIGRRLGRRIAPGDLTRDELVQRSMKVKGAGVPTTRITGPGLPSNPVSFGTPPPPSTAMSPEMMRHLMRENSPLHSDLATHYGEFSGNASYGELEQRFMDDIADKQKHSVPLESSEKQLLKDINQQNDADALAARKQAQEAAVKNEKPPVATLPEKAEPAMQISGLKSGMTTQRGLVHDLAHAIIADEVLGDKLPSLGIRSGLHEENMTPGSISGKKGLASAAFDWTNFEDEDGNIDLSKIKNHLDDIAAMYVAGGVANDIWHDIPYDHNHHLGADMTIMWKIMDKLGIPRDQQIKVIERAGERVVDILNRPGYREVLHDHAAVREPGLDEKMHFSPERIQQVVQDLKGEDNGQIKGKKSSTGNGESVGTTERGAEKRTGTDEAPEAKRPVARQLAENVGKEQQRPASAKSTTDERNPKLAAGQAGSASSVVEEEPELAYRARPVGERGVPVKKRPVATSSLDTARSYKEQLERMTGKPHEVVQIPLKDQDFESHAGPHDGETWFKFNKEVPEELVKHGPENPKLAAAAPPLEAEAEERLPKLDKLSVPAERTAGVHDAAIKAGGGIPGGIQKGDPEINLPDLALFHDPTTGSTLALPVGKITSENVKKQLRESRAQYIEAEDRAKNKSVAEHANDFNNIRGRQEIDSTVKSHSPEFAKRVADAYDQMQHSPNEPKTKAAYDKLKNDVSDQWDYATNKMGIQFEPWTKEGQPYANSKEMTDDVKNNKHLYFFQGGDLPADHPMKAVDPKTGYSYNDKLRAVHDLFGHAAHENQFGPKGEENAYLIHRQMFSPEAVPALTSETRGQNSWVNFGKHLRNPEGNVPFRDEPGYVPPTERPYAQNKAGLLPEEFHGTGPGAWADQINLKTDPSGAIDPKTGSMIGKRYGFEVYPEARETLDHSPTAQDFRAFEQKNAGLLQKHPELRVGWDTLGDKPEINIGVSTDNLDAAKKAASALDQRSVWDTMQKKEIPTGGANKKQAFENYPLEQRLTGLSGVQPENPKLATAVAAPYHPDLQKIVDQNKLQDSMPFGPSFITPDGRFVKLSESHPETIERATGHSFNDASLSEQISKENPHAEDNRVKFLNDTSAIRARIRMTQSGDELVLSVPKQGVTPEQIDAIKKSVGKVRNGSLVIERSDVTPDTKDELSTQRDFPSTNHVEPMLQQINATPKMTAENPKLSAPEKPFDTKNANELTVKDVNTDRWFLNPDGTAVGSTRGWASTHQQVLDAGLVPKEGAIRVIDSNTYEIRQRPTEAQLRNVARLHNESGRRLIQYELISGDEDNSTFRETASIGQLQRDIDQVWPIEDKNTKPENPKLAATVVRPKGSSVGLMDNPLKVKPTGELDRPSTLDVAMALSKFTKKQLPALELGKAEPEEQIERAKPIMEDEAKYQLAQNNTGESWYTKDMAAHDKTLQEMRPELDNPAKLSVFKMIEAVLSSGQKPYANFKSAVKAWDYYHEQGEFPPINPETGLSWGPRSSKGYSNAIEIINRLISEKGEQGASDWLLANHTVKELRGYNTAKTGGRGGGISGKPDDILPGVMVLGPKRGPFAQNLHGQESAFTADMWAARSWNRWMGTIELTPEGDEISTDRLRNEKERDLMKQSFGETADKLGMTTSALQAVLWYYEQALYDAHGSPKESWSFSDAAKRASDEEFNSLKFGEPEEAGLEALAGKR